MAVAKLGRILSEDQKAVIEILRETLAQALEGKINSIAVIACFETGYAHVMAGRQGAHLNMGADSLKREILEAVENAGTAKVSSILRAQ